VVEPVVADDLQVGFADVEVGGDGADVEEDGRVLVFEEEGPRPRRSGRPRRWW
jgi:hypothetical protein